jgi:hypothetical protein
MDSEMRAEIEERVSRGEKNIHTNEDISEYGYVRNKVFLGVQRWTRAEDAADTEIKMWRNQLMYVMAQLRIEASIQVSDYGDLARSVESEKQQKIYKIRGYLWSEIRRLAKAMTGETEEIEENGERNEN